MKKFLVRCEMHDINTYEFTARNRKEALDIAEHGDFSSGKFIEDELRPFDVLSCEEAKE